MPITLKLTFPTGRYQAALLERQVNAGGAEWPPSPWRLLRALVATWKRKCPDLSEDRVRGLLAQLVQPPKFHLPPARLAHARNYTLTSQVTTDFAGDRMTIPMFESVVTIGANASVLIHWPDKALPPDDIHHLGRLVGNLSTFGQAEESVRCELADGSAVDWNCAPAAAAGIDQDLVSVLCPDPGTVFDDDQYSEPPEVKTLNNGLTRIHHPCDGPRRHLCVDTEIVHGHPWLRLPGARWVSYARPADTFTRNSPPCSPQPDWHGVPAETVEQMRRSGLPCSPPPNRSGLPTVARYRLDGPVWPLVTDTIPVAEAFRRALMGCYQRLHHRRKYGTTAKPYREEFRSEVLAGKDAGGRYLSGHDHAHYLPTAETQGHRVTHITVFAEGGFDASTVPALTGLESWRLGALELRSQLIGLGWPMDFRTSIFGGPEGTARVWVSATPYVGPAHVGRRGRERYLCKAVRRELRRWLARRGVEVGVEAVESIADTDPDWSGRPPAIEFRRDRCRAGDHSCGRPVGRFRVKFSSPLDGPLCLGYACHYGLGLFLPSSLAQASER